jgi:hypothetical protein
MRYPIFRRYRWHKRTQLDIALGRFARFGYLGIGWTWLDGHRPVLYWSPDATPSHKRAVGPWRRYGL